MSRYHPQPSDHSMTAHWTLTSDRRWVICWTGTSSWTRYYPGDRLRHPMSTGTTYYHAAEAKRWARRYKVPFPDVPHNTVEDAIAEAEARRKYYAEIEARRIAALEGAT